MKSVYLVLFGLIFLGELTAQHYTPEDRRRDSIKLDSICRIAPADCGLYSDLIGPNSVFRKVEEKEIKPKETSCFDKLIHYSGEVNGTQTEGCFYVNTQDGFVARVTNDSGESCGNVQDFRPGYIMEIHSMMGDSFLYQVDRRGNKTFTAISGNPNMNYGGTTYFEVTNLHNLENDIYELVSDMNFPTLQYKITETHQPSIYYIFSTEFKPKMPLHDYLGMFGVGYYKGEYGNTNLSLVLDSDAQNVVRVDKILDVAVCFDGSSFEDQIQNTIVENNELMDKKEEELEIRSQSGNVDDCEARDLLLEHEKRMLDREKRANELLNNGANLNSVSSQKIILESGDPVNQVIKHKLELQIRICELEYSNYILENEYDNRNQSIQNNNTRIGCLNSSIGKLNDLETQMNAITNQNQNNPGIALGKNSTLYFQAMGSININCNVDKNGNLK